MRANLRSLIVTVVVTSLLGFGIVSAQPAWACSAYNLTGQVTFKTTGDRNQARNGIENYVQNLNLSNPQNAVGGMTSTTLMDEDDFNVVSGPWPAINLSYTVRVEVHDQVHKDIIEQLNTELHPENGVRNVISMSDGCRL